MYLPESPLLIDESTLFARPKIPDHYTLSATAWAISPERFTSLDPNGDGKISKEELNGAPLVFEKLDLNKDGFLDVKEATHLRRAERGSIPVPENIEMLGDLVYKTVGNQKVALDLYRLKGKKYDKAPVLIWIHGGGYRQGDKQEAVENDSNIFVPLLEEHGYLLVSLNYRLTPSGASFVDCYTDCKDAVRFLVKNSDVYGINPSRMVSFGSFAGGGLALILALTRDSDLPGDPIDANEIGKLKLPDSPCYLRKFTGALVVVNPSGTGDPVIVDVPPGYVDWQSKQPVGQVKLPHGDARLLLKP